MYMQYMYILFLYNNYALLTAIYGSLRYTLYYILYTYLHIMICIIYIIIYVYIIIILIVIIQINFGLETRATIDRNRYGYIYTLKELSCIWLTITQHQLK